MVLTTTERSSLETDPEQETNAMMFAAARKVTDKSYNDSHSEIVTKLFWISIDFASFGSAPIT